MSDRSPLVEVLLRQREDWQNGGRQRVEELLDRHTHLQGEEDAVLDLIYNEIVLREECGETIVPEEYYRRFAHLEPALRVQFEVEQAMTLDDVAPSGDARPRLPTLDGVELLDELGRGAMGVIYRGWQTAAKRPVAVKLLSRDVPAARVRIEAEAASRLQHPNIVQVFEVKECEGRTALVLEYVEGGNLAQKLAGKPQPPAVGAHLVETLADAMAYAHGRGVVHRDLKPSNVLLSCGPDEPLTTCVPKIGDFGLAKLMEASVRLTVTSDVLGTPSYMAPEQTGTSSTTVGPAADTYALGAIFYECLTGRPPFLGQSVLDTLDQVRQQEPVPPSRLQPRIPHDLEVICLKCLRKEPQRRYATARELAEDLRRYREGKPIQGRAVSPLERGWKWARRRPAAAAVLLAGWLFLISLGGVGLKLNQVLLQQRDLARDQAEQLDRQLRQTRGLLYTAQLLRVGTVWPSDPAQGLRMLEDETACPPDLRCFSWGVLYGQCKRYRLAVPLEDATVTALAAHPGGKLVATATSAGAVVLRHVSTGTVHNTLRTGGASVVALAFSPDGYSLAAGLADGAVLLWEMPAGKAAGQWKATGRLTGLAWHPNQKDLMIATDAPTITLRDARSGRVVRSLCAAVTGVTCVTVANSGKKLLLGNRDGTVRTWDPARDVEIDRFSVSTGPVTGLALHPDGQILAVAGPGLPTTEAITDVQLWDLVSRRESDPLRGHPGGATAVAFATDGQTLFTAGSDRTLKVWDHPGQRQQVTLRGHEGMAGSVALSGDGRTLAWVSKSERPGTRGQDILVLDLMTGTPINPFSGHGRPIQALALSRDGRQLAVAAGYANEPAEVLVWEVRTTKLLQALHGHPGEVAAVAFSPDGKELASAGREGTLKIWNLGSGKPRREITEFPAPVRALAWSQHGRTLAVLGGEEAAVVLHPAQAGEFTPIRLRAPRGARVLALSADHVAFAGPGGVAHVVGLHDQEARAFLIGMKAISHLAFSPDGHTLAVAGTSTGVKLWDVPTGQERASLPRHRGGACFVGFAEDGQLLVSASVTQTARLWPCVRQVGAAR